jgi:hypothetical protein
MIQSAWSLGCLMVHSMQLGRIFTYPGTSILSDKRQDTLQNLGRARLPSLTPAARPLPLPKLGEEGDWEIMWAYSLNVVDLSDGKPAG